MFTKITNDLKTFHKNEEGDIVQISIIIGIFDVIAIGALAFWDQRLKIYLIKRVNL